MLVFTNVIYNASLHLCDGKSQNKIAIAFFFLIPMAENEFLCLPEEHSAL